MNSKARSTGWALLREITSVFLIGLGALATLVFSILDGNWYVIGSELAVLLGIVLGWGEMTEPPRRDDRDDDVGITIIEQ